MPTGGNANLELQKVVLVASLINGLKTDFGHIIADELFSCAYKTTITLPISCLITELCWKAIVSLIRGVDNEIRASHRQDIKRM